MIKAIIFDFDGVICRTEEFYIEYKYELFKKLGYPLTKEYMYNSIGQNFKQFFLKQYPNLDDYNGIYQLYRHAMLEVNPPYEDIFNDEIFELLYYCKKNKIKCAIASNTPVSRVIRDSKLLKIDSYMDELIGADIVKCEKPNPDFYRYACKKLNVLVSEAIVVEDSAIGIQAAIDAGIYTVAKNAYPLKINQSKASNKVDRLDEVISIIESLAYLFFNS